MDPTPPPGPKFNVASLLIGGLLVLLGVLFLFGQFLNLAFDFDLGHYAWPLFIILPGVTLYLAALTFKGDAGIPLAIIGSMVSMTGLLLAYQNLTNHWASWAYAWALVAPTSFGVGLALYGALKGRSQQISAGLRLAGIGLAIFLVGAMFFELIVGISGFGFGFSGVCWPLLLIGLGVLFLALNFIPRRRTGA